MFQRSLKKGLWVSAVLLTSALAALVRADDYAAVTPDGRGAVATVQPRATEAAMKAYAEGGNAIDAAVAAALTLGVVDGHNSGIGGGIFAVVHWADGRVEAIDGREMAPGKAHRTMYVRDGDYRPELSKKGPLAVGIPGAVAAYDYMMKKGGKARFATHLEAAATLADEGFAIDGIFARRLARHTEDLLEYPGSAAIFLTPEGKPWPVGHRIRQPDLARTYRAIASEGPEYFYGGGFAKAVGDWMAEHGGIVTREDFANYELLRRKPVVSDYRGYRIYGFPPPSSGGVHVAQMLNILEGFDVDALSEADRYHLLAEVMRLAFADRAYWLGDPAFASVPKGLISERYADKLRERLSLKSVAEVTGHSTPPKSREELFGKHTTHIATADQDGNWVAITATVNTNFGSKVVVPGTGVILNNQMDDFSAQPGEPNAYGLLGAEANSIAPGKRPLSSMSPTVVTRDGKPVLTLGAAGGPTIITQVVQALVNHIDLGMPLEDALVMDRIHHQWRPNQLFVEKTLITPLRTALEEKGHELRRLGDYGSTQAIGLDEQGRFISVAEPRLEERNKVE
ncbi:MULTISPECIES: gamma-glutamyltransferase [unclassified Marinimicrobium]|jgi:gamma-glutamyltranspeptidase/glutathione hydrolase|uniref:gamma-glutamyltransferase n=1 Tax=unclassified Marinimicrobium TaxID=2632100 RepID=UPI0025794C38|nr:MULTISPECIES: gamma-glutamyltransferase [unclassified Marinimicrobium]